MKIEVLLFAQLREILGADSRVIEIEDGRTVREVADGLIAETEGSVLDSLPLRFAVNEEFVDDEHLLRDGDRLALLTPVSGG